MGKSDGESSQHSEDEQSTSSTNRGLLTTLDAGPPGGKKDAKVIAAVPSTPMTAAQPPSSAFDLEKALMNIPALRPEEFQRRIQLARQQQRTTTTHMSPRGTDTPMEPRLSPAPAQAQTIRQLEVIHLQNLGHGT